MKKALREGKVKRARSVRTMGIRRNRRVGWMCERR